MDIVDTDCRCNSPRCTALRDLINGGLMQHVVHLSDEDDEFRIVGWNPSND